MTPDAARTDLDTVARSLPQGGRPVEDILTAGQPERPQLQAAREAGVQVVVDLRAAHEERGIDEPAVVEELGMRYVHLPVTPPPSADVFERVRTTLREHRGTPLLLHCASANRVGAVLLPHLVLDRGWSMEDAVKAAREVGLTHAGLESAARAYAEGQAQGEARGG